VAVSEHKYHQYTYTHAVVQQSALKATLTCRAPSFASATEKSRAVAV
jgi:hypothetical protein